MIGFIVFAFFVMFAMAAGSSPESKNGASDKQILKDGDLLGWYDREIRK